MIDDPILNSPFKPPTRHFALDDAGEPPPKSGRIAVKAINHDGDEVMMYGVIRRWPRAIPPRPN